MNPNVRSLLMMVLLVSLSISFTFSVVAVPAARARQVPPEAKQSSRPLQGNARLEEIVARLERNVPQWMKEGDVPGLSIALVRDGEVAWNHAFGVKNAKTKEPVADSTVFEAASLSKPVFAYAVMKLVDSGKFDLDKPLNQYLPGDYDVGPDPRLGQITARRVLSHTTGFPNWRGRDTMLKIYFTPGERFSYSGEGFVYLSKVIEHVTGEQFNDFMKRTVFDPLGMTSSSYVWQPAYDTVKTSRHDALGQPSQQSKPTGANAAASLHTTTQDYGRFVGAILKGTGLKKETFQQMLTAQIKVDEGGSNTTSKPASKLSPNLSWGLGWGLQSTTDGLSFWHWGDNGDSKAYVVAFERQRLGVVVFANSANGLSFMPELVNDAIGGEQPALAWIKYESYKSPARLLLKHIIDEGVEASLREYRKWRTGRAAAAVVSEDQMNRIGYALLGQKRVKDAIEVFKLNVEDYPQSSNTYDSLGEAYMIDGAKDLAITNYQRSIELNPKNTGGIEALKKLREGPKN
ncbi:MAG TPA: serine hydrolase [Blastocatellia bacterium]|nr:serine hydrolase [Blastocatellia bacterium]